MKTLGIIGGMGPLATADIYKKITELTLASCDAEHLHIYIDSNVGIPDRTQAILEGTNSPIKELIVSAKKLEAMGADFLIIACNTAHYFYNEVAGSVSIPVLNMIDEAANTIQNAGLKKVAILSTTGTLKSRLYSNALAARNIEALVPTEDEQKVVMSAIYDCVKASNFRYDSSPFISILERLQAQGAEAFLLGCTELPVFFSHFKLNFPIFDSATILAEKTILFAGYSVAQDVIMI